MALSRASYFACKVMTGVVAGEVPELTTVEAGVELEAGFDCAIGTFDETVFSVITGDNSVFTGAAEGSSPAWRGSERSKACTLNESR